MNTFDEFAVRRDTAGRFDEKPQSAPEAALPAAVRSEAGDRVRLRGRAAHRVIRHSPGMFVLRTPSGGTLIAAEEEVEPLSETPAQRRENERIEQALLGMRASMRTASRQQRERLAQSPSASQTTVLMRAQDRVIAAVRDGHVDRELWQVSLSAAADAPLGAKNAMAAVVARAHITAADYQVLTESWSRNVGPLN